MKKLKRIYGWILISVLLQSTILAYFNFIYLPGRGAFRATMYEAEMAAVKNRSYKLPEGAKNITVSFDGLLAAYTLGNKLEIADLDRKKVIKKLEPDGGKFSYFRWLPDREMLIYSIREPDSISGCVRISTYDIGPELDRSYPDIKNLPEGSEIIDIELSPLTNIVYPMIKTSDKRARIYKFDIMDTLKLIMKTDLTTMIKETMYSDNLIYRVLGENIKIRNGRSGKTTRIPVEEAKVLLAVDDADVLYAGTTDNSGKLTAIWFGKIGQKADEWKMVTPPQPLAEKDLYITAGGSIHAVDTENKRIQGLNHAGNTDYQGEIISVLDHYIATMDGNKLIMKVIKK